ncbi:MAG: hypothetical protein QMD09_09555 [Desulfatibacillaceae bacterium]|nr:hypothetical protein [Desulfatibacillaceae bacterium]
MGEKRYNVMFEGIEEDKDPDDVRAALAKVLDLSPEEAEAFLLDEPTLVAVNADKETAMSLRLGMFRAGAICTVSACEDVGLPPKEAEVPGGPWTLTTCPHCNTRQQPARECKFCGMRMKKTGS